MTGRARHFDVAIMQPNYLPWLGYFDLIAVSDVFVVYDDVQFDKHGWRNRNRLFRRPEPLWITAPVRTSGRFGQTVAGTELVESGWPEKHIKMIRQTYAKAPFFEWCFPPLETYLRGRPYRHLLDLCLEGQKVICGLLGLSPIVKLASDIGFAELGPTERLIAICSRLGATRYVSPNASKAYIVESLWPAAGIDLAYQNYAHPEYAQFGSPFLSHLSIIDALMFAGPDSRAMVGISHRKERLG